MKCEKEWSEWAEVPKLCTKSGGARWFGVGDNREILHTHTHTHTHTMQGQQHGHAVEQMCRTLALAHISTPIHNVYILHICMTWNKNCNLYSLYIFLQVFIA